ncbi:MAG: glutamate-cysteine ligase family protein [Proteobacteria bacterium]|nr:glutamate-cysteine ligase family protein [Pseudomonadota bacterium]
MHLSSEQLRAAFFEQITSRQRIGVEIEIAALCPKTGRSVPYEGAVGIRSLLQRLHRVLGGEWLLDGDNPVGLDFPDGSGFSLESGGAVEYRSAPVDSLTLLKRASDAALAALAEAGLAVGIALVPGGNVPFNGLDEFHWMPKRYGEAQRQYFCSLGDDGATGPLVMSHSTSTQVTLDYSSEREAVQMVQVGVALTPLVVALFANSPIEAGRSCGAVSRRTQYFYASDPTRFGFTVPALKEDMSLQDFVDWALDFRMIYRKRSNGAIAPVERTFREILLHGFADGSVPGATDWTQHLSQIYTDVRWRSRLELRAADGPPNPYMLAVPAFWSGLLYHEPTRAAVWQLVRGHSLTEMHRLREQAAIKGLEARHGDLSMAEVAREVVKWARRGVEERVRKGVEDAEALTYLDPLEEIATTGETFAERCLRLWDGPLGRSPSRYIEHFRI